MRVAIAKNKSSNIIDSKTFETSKTDPNITIDQVISYLEKFKFDALGIASFGPIDLNKQSKTYGYITTSPKAAWRNFNVLGPFKKKFEKEGFPEIQFDTDVNAPAIAEIQNGSHG